MVAAADPGAPALNLHAQGHSTMTAIQTIPRFQSRQPAGWHWMGEFVDKDGTVYHRGVEQPKLKGTLSPTEVKPKKQTKRRSQEEILLAREAEKKAALKKEFKKQKDFLNHKLGE